jgi:hypothetical protein
MPEVRRGIRSPSRALSNDSNPTSPDRRVTFENGRDIDGTPRPNDARVDSSNSLAQIISSDTRPRSKRRPSSHHHHSDREERDAYYDSRAATHSEYRRRASNLQSYYVDHPDLLPQLPFTFRHGFKRWKLGGYIILMVIDACVIPIVLYYALTFGGNVEGFITFAVVTAIWGGPTYVEFAVRSIRLIKEEKFYKPLGVDKRWAFDITNWILILTIASITALLIVGAAPHIVFLRVLSMPGPAILYCLAGPILLMSLYSAFGWKAPFQISSTAKGERVLPGIYYIVEDIVAVNAGGGRPFREGWAARYNASPIFRKMLSDLSWFWSIPALFIAVACTVVICIHPVKASIGYGIGSSFCMRLMNILSNLSVGWAVPFIWAAVWAAITVPWVQSVLHREKTSWEEESAIISDTMKPTNAPPAAAHGPLNERPSEARTSETAVTMDTTEEPKTPKERTHVPEEQLSKREQRENE